MTESQAFTRCHDCAAEPGQPHTDGCDVARCTVCGWQRISCDHYDQQVGWGAIWTGEWPGDEECREFGLWCTWSDGTGWQPGVTADTPGAMEDLNALHIMARSGQVEWNGQRWVKP